MKTSTCTFALVTLAVILVITEIPSAADAACKCLNRCAGKHCGRSPLMSAGCNSNDIYQCNGKYGSTAYRYGPCRKGCVYKGCSRDYCRS